MKKFTFEALCICLILGMALVSSEMDDQGQETQEISDQVAMEDADTEAQGDVKPIDWTESNGNFSGKRVEMVNYLVDY